MKRSLELSSRKESTRNKHIPSVVRFESSEILKHYEESVSAVNEMFVLADNLLESANEHQAKNIWRAQIVFLVSALDFFMHEITKYGLSKIFDEVWEPTVKYKNINISIDVLNRALKAGENTDWFVEFVNNQYAIDTMVSFAGVKDQMNLLGLDMQRIANEVFYEQGSNERTIDKLKYCLNDLFAKRNVIAHQSDRRHQNAEMMEIKRESVYAYIESINKIVGCIISQINEK